MDFVSLSSDEERNSGTNTQPHVGDDGELAPDMDINGKAIRHLIYFIPMIPDVDINGFGDVPVALSMHDGDAG